MIANTIGRWLPELLYRYSNFISQARSSKLIVVTALLLLLFWLRFSPRPPDEWGWASDDARCRRLLSWRSLFSLRKCSCELWPFLRKSIPHLKHQREDDHKVLSLFLCSLLLQSLEQDVYMLSNLIRLLFIHESVNRIRLKVSTSFWFWPCTPYWKANKKKLDTWKKSNKRWALGYLLSFPSYVVP